MGVGACGRFVAFHRSVPPSRMLLLIAAEPREYAGFPGLVEHSSRDVRWLATTVIRGVDAVLVANGIGRRNAAAGTRTMIAGTRIHAVLSIGFAGALDPVLGLGEVVVADQVLDGSRVYPAGWPLQCPADVQRGSVVTVNEVVQFAESKLALGQDGARAVDMESAAVAEIAQEHRLPFYCVRAISDTAEQDLPVDFNRALRADGTVSPWSVLGQAGLSPGSWLGLARLRRNSRIAADSLARCLPQLEFDA